MNEQQSSPIIGQVVEASIASFTAQSLELHQAPPLGSLVKTDGPIYAVVCDARTESIDGRRPVAHLSGETDLQSVLDTNPHLRHLLRTTFDAVVVGHGDGPSVRHYLPPSPTAIFTPVRLCPQHEVARFSQSLDFLRLLLSAAANSDDVVAACLRLASAAHPDRRAFLVAAGRELTRLLATEPNRLTAILRRIQP
ncbi:MAG: hypothetical protein ACUVV3_08530 [Dehalococcoidia bacterium]